MKIIHNSRPVLVTRVITILSLVFQFSITQAQELAPDIELTTLESKSIKLSDFRNKVVYIDFWATWCGPCRKSIPWMDQMHQRYSEKGLQIIAISIDNKKQLIERFLQRYPHDYTIAHDPLGVTTKAFNVQVMPTSFLIDQQGNIVKTHKGFNDNGAQELEQEIKRLLKVN